MLVVDTRQSASLSSLRLLSLPSPQLVVANTLHRTSAHIAYLPSLNIVPSLPPDSFVLLFFGIPLMNVYFVFIMSRQIIKNLEAFFAGMTPCTKRGWNLKLLSQGYPWLKVHFPPILLSIQKLA